MTRITDNLEIVDNKDGTTTIILRSKDKYNDALAKVLLACGGEVTETHIRASTTLIERFKHDI